MRINLIIHRPRDSFKRQQSDKEEVVNVRYEFFKTKRFNRLNKMQETLYPFANASTTNGSIRQSESARKIADGGKLTRSLASLFNKSKIFKKAHHILVDLETTGNNAAGATTKPTSVLQTPANEQSTSIGGTTFFTEVKND